MSGTNRRRSRRHRSTSGSPRSSAGLPSRWVGLVRRARATDAILSCLRTVDVTDGCLGDLLERNRVVRLADELGNIPHRLREEGHSTRKWPCQVFRQIPYLISEAADSSATQFRQQRFPSLSPVSEYLRD